METTSPAPPSSRTVTVDEAVALTGLSKTAVQRRIDRGTIRAVVRDGRRRIPVSELRRVGLLDATGAPVAPVANTGGGASTHGTGSTPPGGTPGDASAVTVLVARLEELSGEIARHRLLTSQAESRVASEAARAAALEADLHQTRAELATAEARLEALSAASVPPSDVDTSQGLHAAEGASRPWWAFWRSGAATPGDAAHGGAPSSGSIPGIPPAS